VFDYDVVVVGGGPAGLTAGLHLSQARHRALLLEKELYGGNLKNVEVIEDYPLPAGTTGAQLASQMAEQAAACGLRLQEAEVTGIEVFSSTRWVGCDGGRGYSAAVVIVATGTHFGKLGIPGEDRLLGRGVVDCTPCDGPFFRGRAVAVCGSDEHALADALYLAKLGASVTLLTTSADLRVPPGIDVRSGVSVQAILGADRVEGVALTDTTSGREETMSVDGVVVRVGSEPNTSFLADVVDLDPTGRVITAGVETSAPQVLAAGDVRARSRPRIAAAVADGTAAALRAEALLLSLPRS
jgi:thioredoxin reductase (NADPH)